MIFKVIMLEQMARHRGEERRYKTEVCFNPKAGVIHWGCVDHHTACKKGKRVNGDTEGSVF